MRDRRFSHLDEPGRSATWLGSGSTTTGHELRTVAGRRSRSTGTSTLAQRSSGREGPGPPERGGAWETACGLVSEYEFADARILRGIYWRDSEFLGRNMLLETWFFGLRFYLGVRVTAVIDEERDTGDGPERVWGWW